MTRAFRKNVGIIGLGIIGRRIADHLRHQGLAVFVWNRTPRPVPNFVGSPIELAETCNYLQMFVSDDDALMRMIQVISPALTSQHVVIAHPTVSSDTMREAAMLVERRGARLVEAPFTGSKLAAEKGQLVYYVGGDEAALQEVRPLLQASSKAIVDIGGIGNASIIKVATNMVTAASVQAAAEAMALVHYSGIPLEKFEEAMKSNASNSATLDLKIPRIGAADFDPHFSVKHMLKDMQIANRMGRHFDLDLTVAGATRDRLLDEARQGRGDQDFSSIARRFLPFVQTPEADQEQPDLFAQPTPHESPEFVEQQLAQLEATSVGETVPVEALPESIIAFESHETSAVCEEAEPAEVSVNSDADEKPVAVEESEVTAELPAETAQLSHEEEEKRSFLRRLLRRTADY